MEDKTLAFIVGFVLSAIFLMAIAFKDWDNAIKTTQMLLVLIWSCLFYLVVEVSFLANNIEKVMK